MGNGNSTPDNPSLAAQLVDWAASQAGASNMRKAATDTDKSVRTSGHDPDYIPAGAVESFLSMPHQKIVEAVNSMKPGSMHDTAQAWRKIGDASMFNTMGLTSKLRNSVAQGWEGATADAILAATRRFTDELTDMHAVTQSVASRVESAAYGAEVVKGAVPSVPTPPGSPAVPGAENPATIIGHITAASDAEQEARQAMINYYVPAYQPAGQQVPVYLPPSGPNDGSGPNVPGINGTGRPGGTGGRTSSSEPNTPSGDPEHGPQSQNDQRTKPASTDSSPANTDPSALANSPTGQGNTSGNNPQGSGTAGVATTPASVGPSATTPSSVGGNGGGLGGGSGRPGGGIGGRGTPGSAGPGRSIPGVPAAGNPGSPAGLGARSPAAGSAGMPGMPGMAPHGAKGKGEDDEKEHKGKPELLVHERNKIDLLGEPSPAVPPAFGADAFEPSNDWTDERKNPRTSVNQRLEGRRPDSDDRHQ
ncbi:PPE domain-containing protein [Nocardia sp. NPDC051570]|uniref:WXG100 family type VII secretion target n=1 Tax=Nocardia sp. NPDC051570 TaxID=3364324 RepID=UPI003796B29B